MRQFIASAVIAAIVFTVASPTFAQRTRRAKPVVRAAPPVQTGGNSIADFDSIQAVTSGVGVVVQWTMRQENRVAAYQVYRTDARGRVAVGNPVLGSAAKTREDAMYGESYSTYDPEGTSNSVYEIEAMSASNGGKTTSSQTSAKFQRGAALAVANADVAAQASATNSTLESFAPDAPKPENVAPNLTNQQWIASQPAAKIGVKADGLYRVTRAELQAAGFNLASNSTNWRLFESGNEQPMIVGAGDQYIEFYGHGLDTAESDTRMYYLVADTVPGVRMQTHTFRSNSGTSFAGNFRNTVQMKERVNYVDTVFNGDAENFWGNLIFSSSIRNELVTLPNVDPNGADAVVTVTLQGFSSTSHDVSLTLNGQALSSHMTGQFLDNFSKSYTIPAASLVSGTNTLALLSSTSTDFTLFDNVRITYTAKYQAFKNAATVFSAGRRKVALNGFSSPAVSTVTVMNATVAQPAAGSTTTTVASSTAGSLRLSAPTYTAGTGGAAVARLTVSRVFGSTGTVGATINLANGTATGGGSCGAGVDYVIPASTTVSLASGVNSITFDVPLCAGNIADPNGETFTATLSAPTGGATIPTSNVRVFDITYDTPQIIGGLTPMQSGNNFGVTLPSYRASTVYAVDDSYAMQAASVTSNTPSTLSATSNAADMVIISYSDPNFIAAANNWATYRRSATGGSFNVKVVDVTDIYDEFGYGVRSSSALSAFLKFAYQNWQTAPKYALLVGDGSYDPRNYEGNGDWDLVPTKMVELVFHLSGSDEALADFNGDGLSEIPIGRIPARDAATVAQLQAKMQAQETPAMLSFNRGAVFVNDQPIGYDFASMNQTLRNELTNVPTATFVSRGPDANTTDPNGPQNVLNALNTGPYIVNYAGHGAAGLWGSSAFFQNTSVSSLTNSNQSVYTMLTCFNGYYLRTNADCLAETLLKSSGGGASIAWASTTDTTPDIQLIMGQRFYHQLNAGTFKRVGDLISDAKAQIPGGSDVRYSWTLLGDPATQIRQ